MNTADAYARCEEITSSQAKNFSYGIRLLPPPRRRALSAIYAMARRVDDIADGDLPRAEKLGALTDVRKALADLPTAPADDPVLVSLADAAARYPIPVDAFGELIDGCEADLADTPYATLDELVGYCRLVAGSIGRLSLGVFGTSQREKATPRADALGVALQLTNILRDVVEDRAELGRVYLPSEDLARFSVSPQLGGAPQDLAALILYEARRSLPYWDEGLTLLPLLDRRSRACVAAMAGIYRRLLDAIQRRPGTVFEGRLSLPGREKALVAVAALARGRV